jgi:Flp pilus assembly pilin Flp
MHTLLLKVYVFATTLLSSREAQNLVEYSLMIAVLAFGSVAGMHSLASGVTIAFDNVSTDLATVL